MAKNKPANLGIGDFMNNVKESSVKARLLENEVVQDDVEDTTQAVIEEVAVKKQPTVGVGKLKKKATTIRNVVKPVKVDEELSQQLALIKALYKIDLQDFVYVATMKFRDEYFPKGKATKEGLAIIDEALKQLNGQ